MIKTTPRTSNGCTARSAARCWAASPPRAWVRAAERGAPAPFAELEADNRAVLADVRAALDGRERDWAAYHRTTVAMHRANATAWAGVDRIAQIDPDFVPD
jgi:CO dehydrogenase maturation factor